MKDNDTTVILGNDTPPLAENLQRIADHERGLRTIPRAIQSAGRTRAFAAFYRRFGPKSDPWLFHKTHGQAALRLGFPGTAPYHYGRQVGASPGDAADVRA